MEEKEKLLKVRDVARRLDVSEQTIRNWIRDGKLRSVRIGRVIRIPEVAVEGLIQAGTKNDGDVAEVE